MTLEAKKTICMVVGAMDFMVVIAGITLMSMQIKTFGSSLFISYFIYALVILVGGLVLAILPRMVNYGWGPKIEDGKFKPFQKKVAEVDVRRTRLVLWPLITLFFELYGLADYSNDIWPSNLLGVLRIVFMVMTIATFVIWLSIIIVEDYKRNRESH